jgi:acyl-CoA thioester hydrolase
LLTHETEVIIRFNEADPLGIVWHGHYIRYFEDGRESFGKKYGISYLDFYNHGLAVPVVSIDCQYKRPLRYGDILIVEASYIPTEAAKLKFNYKMFESKEGELVAVGSSLQVFVNAKTFDLQLTNPAFFEQWKKKWKLD